MLPEERRPGREGSGGPWSKFSSRVHKVGDAGAQWQGRAGTGGRVGGVNLRGRDKKKMGGRTILVLALVPFFQDRAGYVRQALWQIAGQNKKGFEHLPARGTKRLGCQRRPA